MNEKQHPLIIVFYLDAEMMGNREIIQPFVEAVNDLLHQKDSNALAFFLPTKGEERIECINPVIMAEPDMEKISQMVEDIRKSFDVAPDINIPDEEITLDEKPCDCGDNVGGKCNC